MILLVFPSNLRTRLNTFPLEAEKVQLLETIFEFGILGVLGRRPLFFIRITLVTLVSDYFIQI
jgi:hypothetical protein